MTFSYDDKFVATSHLHYTQSVVIYLRRLKFYTSLTHPGLLGLALHTMIVVVADYLVELMNDSNKEVYKLCSKALDIIKVSGEIMIMIM